MPFLPLEGWLPSVPVYMPSHPPKPVSEGAGAGGGGDKV